MPTYSYRCTECGNAFDVQQSFTDDSLTVCPSCGGLLRKVFSPVGVSFTGAGFYRNDSRAAPPKEKAKKESTSGDGSTSATPAAKDAAAKAAPARNAAAAQSTPGSGSRSGKKE
ncbi:putative FmdB family regulatory protein [Cryobacterium mesophilum]|uniref:FmdB family transcriptional regulator n=1 Tax=Terrimesophilobacter mesophilus TaxID=433647 RepID=A0A4R8VCX2_9MICO|nr:FmdB family zinc ribbon protein [Terrimesophilobacter mesophilus]MBB5633621.1 putative FmdB family regulatory protein [Terrimesophilobacter mesophilus]TFB80316.1 FmdB family transcriptional regulator [Terrimesophilobacter mesophilus]